MKSIKKITVASILSVAVVAAFAGGSASAATTYNGGNVDDSGKLQITRKVSGVSNPVSNVYSYTITADSDNPAAATGFPSTSTITFSSVAPVSNVATATSTLDFSSTNYTQVGDYYYTIAESSSSNAGTYPKTDATYKAVVSVRYAVDGNNVPTGDLVATVAAQVLNSSDTKQNAEITTGSSRTHIEASQEVKGNSADVNKCFKYQLDIPAKGTLALAGDTYTVSTSSTCEGNTAAATVGGTNYFYLKHGDTITVGLNGAVDEMPIGLDYTIALTSKDDYENPVFNGVQQSSLSTPTKTTVALTDSNFNAANKTPISIEKNISPKTGVLVSVFPFIILAALAGAGAIYVSSKAKKNA